MASKSKEKLKKYQLKVGGNIINLDRLAYDVFVHSGKTFGLAETCFDRWKGDENDYRLPDFIVVLSRFSIKSQIVHRNIWYTEFKSYYESTKFDQFDKIKSSLRQIIYEKARLDQSLILHEAMNTLAVICELILFLSKNNCKLYLMDLAKFWRENLSNKRKEIEKAGGFQSLYWSNNAPHKANMDVFFNQFIPAHCIPYSESGNLIEVFNKEYGKFFNLSEETVAKTVQLMETIMGGNRIIGQKPSSDYETSERVEPSGINLPINTGLGIQKHEDLLRYVHGTDVVTSPQDLPSTIHPRTERERRLPSSRKYGQKKKPSSRSSMESLEVSGIDAPRNTSPENQTFEDLFWDVFEVGTETSPQDLPSTSLPRTERERRGASSRKERQKKKPSPRSSMEILEASGIDAPRNTSPENQTLEDLIHDVFGADFVTSPQGLPSASRPRTERERREASSQKEGGKKKPSSRSSMESLEASRIDAPRNTGIEIRTHKDLVRDVCGADVVTSPLDLPSTSLPSASLPRTERQRREASSRKGQKKKSSSRSSMEILEASGIDAPRNTSPENQTFEDLFLDVFEIDTVTSPQDLPSTSRPRTKRERREASSQKKGGKKKPSSRSSMEIPEASGIDAPRNTSPENQTFEDLFWDVFEVGTATSPKDLPSTSRPRTERERRGAASRKERRKKKSSSSSIVEDLEQLNLDATKKPSGEKKK